MSPATSQDPVVELLDADVGDVQDARSLVLEKVQWTVRAGEFWVIAGMNRSGKSALISTAAGLTPPRRGLCRLFGYDTRYPDDLELRASRVRLGIVFEGGRLLHGLKVWENISLPLRYHGNLSAQRALEQIKSLLDVTGLAPWSNASTEGMGRHWQQRVGLARALVLQPELLLVDNPLAGLDPEEMEWWVATLQRLANGDSELSQKPLTIIVTDGSFHRWRGERHHYAILRNRALQVLAGEPSAEITPALASSLSAGGFASQNGMNT